MAGPEKPFSGASAPFMGAKAWIAMPAHARTGTMMSVCA